ncbi:MAG TPA: HNH endonuclease signature motif containing protein [Candidatus Angelobacter sp.]
MSRSTIAPKELKLLCLRSGNLCAFPNCKRELVSDGGDPEEPVVLGEVAHIIAESPEGPRGTGDALAAANNSYENLILVCGDHHKLIDSQPHTFTIDVLKEMKAAHERRVRPAQASSASTQLPQVAEDLTATALIVTHLPQYVYVARCKYTTGEDALVKQETKWPSNRNILTPFLLKNENIYCFQDLRKTNNPFRSVMERGTEDHIETDAFCSELDGERDFVTLLNRSLYKFAARRNVRYDPEHRRFYFESLKPGTPRTVKYKSLTGRTVSRESVWNPVRRATGEPRKYWWHLAAGLRFHRVDDASWILSIRPERHLTSDGITPLPPAMIGRRVTSAKSHMFNYQYLSEVGFWRDFMCNGEPRMIIGYGNQSTIISSSLHQLCVTWPGIPGDEKAIKTEGYEETLFTMADFELAMKGNSVDLEDEEDYEEENE